MSTHESPHHPVRPSIGSIQARALVHAPVIWHHPAPVPTTARAADGEWDTVLLLAVLSLVLCSIAALCVLQRVGLLPGAAARRVAICNSFDYSSTTARCTAADTFVVVHQGRTSASLQIGDAGDLCRSRRPVTVSVSETNGAGLVLASGSTTQILTCTGTGTVVLPLAGVLARTGVPLASVPAGSSSWVRDVYEVQVRAGATILDATTFHLAR